MPFVVKEFEVKEKTKAFLFLMKEMGYTQKEAQKINSKRTTSG